MDINQEDTFDFRNGVGPVPAHRHVNPDGRLGGWVANTATVAATVGVGGDAQVYEYARVFDSVWVSDAARVFGHAEISENAWIRGYVHVHEHAHIKGHAQILNSAKVYGRAIVRDDAKIGGHAGVYDSAEVSEFAVVCEQARVYGAALVYGNARIDSNTRIAGFNQVWEIVAEEAVDVPKPLGPAVDWMPIYNPR